MRRLDEVPVDLEHDGPPVGVVAHLETREGGLFAVACLDDLEPSDFNEIGPVYYSGEFETMATRGRNWIGRNPRLLSLALTTTPAQLALQPVTMLEGDVRRPADVHRWPMNIANTPILQRAAETARHHHRGHGLYISDLRRSATGPAPGRVRPGDILHRPGRILSIGGQPVHDTGPEDYQRYLRSRFAPVRSSQ